MSSDHEDSGNKRQRVSRACDLCRRKKIKCNGLVPICTNCKEYDLVCTYNDTTKKRGPPKGYIEAIENRLHKLEGLLREMAQGDDPKSKSLLHELNTPLETPAGERIFNKPQRRAPPNSDRNKVFMWQQNSPVRPKEEPIDFIDSPSSPLDTSTSSTAKGNNLKLSPIADLIGGVDTTGQLAMDANGQYRYLGKSSGFYLLQKSRTYHHGAFHLSGNRQLTSLYNGSSISPSPVSSPSSPMTSVDRSTTKIDPLELPSPELSTNLIQLYFRYFYPILPLFYKKQLSSSLDDPSEPISPLLLNSIYAVASRMSDDPLVRSDPNLPETAGDIFFERARMLLDSHYDVPRIATVQSLLLLSSHQQGTRKSARAWLYSGMAFRMALDLGLNRDCEHWQIPPDEKERRKRVFWCCFVCDKTASATYGRSSIFEESDCDVAFPTIDDDEPVYTANASAMGSPGPLMVLTHLVSICDILGHVLKNIYYAKALRHSDMRHISHIVSSLTGRLTHWYKHLPPSLRIDNTNQHATYPSCVSYLHMAYHATVILLHRLFIPNKASDISRESLREYNICVESATSIMNIANGMLKSNILRYSFQSTNYFIFTAGIIFINSASSNNATTSFDAKVSINNIMRLLKDLEKTWTSASRSANILGELAGLRDLNLPTSENTLRPIVHPMGTSPYSPTTSDIGTGSSIMATDTKRRYFVNDDKKWNQHGSMAGTLDLTNNTLFNSDLQGSNYIGVSQQGLQQQQQQHSKGNMDPFAAPDTIPVSFPQRQFDLSGAAFWGVPPSLDLAEWNHYLGTQLPAYQEQQQMPDVSTSSASPSSMNAPLPPHQRQPSSQTGTAAQPPLILSRNIKQYPPATKPPTTASLDSMYTKQPTDAYTIDNTMTSSPAYNRRPSSFSSSTLANISSPGTRNTQKHLIHNDANVDILSGMPVPLDLRDDQGGNTTSMVMLLGDQQETDSGVSSHGYGASDLLGDAPPRNTDLYGSDSMIYY